MTRNPRVPPLSVPTGLVGGPAQPTNPSILTEREIQVAQLLAEGLSNKLIADRLGISDHTAKFHVTGIMSKLAASTRTGAVVEALRRGIISLEKQTTDLAPGRSSRPLAT